MRLFGPLPAGGSGIQRRTGPCSRTTSSFQSPPQIGINIPMLRRSFLPPFSWQSKEVIILHDVISRKKSGISFDIDVEIKNLQNVFLRKLNERNSVCHKTKTVNFPCTPWRYMEGKKLQRHSYLTGYWMKVSGLLQVLAALPPRCARDSY